MSKPISTRLLPATAAFMLALSLGATSAHAAAPAKPTAATGSCPPGPAGESVCTQESVGGAGQFSTPGPSQGGWATTNTGPSEGEGGSGGGSGEGPKCGEKGMTPVQRKLACERTETPAPSPRGVPAYRPPK